MHRRGIERIVAAPVDQSTVPAMPLPVIVPLMSAEAVSSVPSSAVARTVNDPGRSGAPGVRKAISSVPTSAIRVSSASIDTVLAPPVTHCAMRASPLA